MTAHREFVIKAYGQNIWNGYQGFRSMGQVMERADISSSESCQCCTHVRQSLVQAAVSGTEVVWLADAQLLHAAASLSSKKDVKKCGFCKIIYQQFWAWQDANYRLQSQLWAPTIRQIEASGEAVHVSEMVDIWKGISRSLERFPDACFQDTYLNSSSRCPTETCNLCLQDNTAILAFGDSGNVCEACKKAINEHDADIHITRLQPVIPLLLKPRITSDGISLSTLGVKHAAHTAGVWANSGTSREWIWTMYTIPDDGAAAFIPLFHHASYDDERVYEQVRTWIAACAQHPICQSRRSKSPTLPARVLEVNDSGCRLLETSHETGGYVALSYCWGAAQPEKLTKSDVDSYKQYIDSTQLPKTVQQAITATKKLGFKYLWVDSMNIIQDDVADKVREISKMREIYNHSAVTLSATGASRCTEGFFDSACQPGTTFRTPDVGLNYPCTLPDGSTGHLRLIERAEYKPDAEPLNYRGWTYQEKMLPVSVVNFGACLSWECHELSETRTVTSLTGGIDSDVPFSRLFSESKSTEYSMRNALHGLAENWCEPKEPEVETSLGAACPVAMLPIKE